MRKLETIIKGTITLTLAVMFTSVFGTSLGFAASGGYTKKAIDSNTFTTIAIEAKDSNDNYGAMNVMRMFESHDGRIGEEADYTYLWGRMTNSSDSNIVDTDVLNGAATDDSTTRKGFNTTKGAFLMQKGQTVAFLFQNRYSDKGTTIKVKAEGHKPSLDCFATGNWNIDRANANVN